MQRLVRILGTVDRYAALISPRKSREGRSAAESLRALTQQQRYSDEVGFALVRAVGLCPPGTYVRLDNGDIAVVLRRGEPPQPPLVASVIGADGASLYPPVIHEGEDGPASARHWRAPPSRWSWTRARWPSWACWPHAAASRCTAWCRCPGLSERSGA